MTENINVQADQLLAVVIRAKEIKQVMDQHMEAKLTIAGQPFSHWENRLKVRIPRDNMSLQLCREVSIKLMELNQEISFYLAATSAKLDMYTTGVESRYLQKFHELVQQYSVPGKKLPAAQTLEVLAKIETRDIETAKLQTEMEHTFWKRMLDKIERDRKYIETIQMSIQSEMKADKNGSFASATPWEEMQEIV